jgi:DNA-directed RNA polymerase II subunit RPB1
LLKIQSDPLGNLWDSSGDEMNLHMPQDTEAEMELRNLAAVNNHLISPAKNSSIIGIFQDSMLGAYQFSRANLNFTPREAMNLLMEIKNVDEKEIQKILKENNDKINSFDILSQILPPLSIKYETEAFKKSKEKENYATSNKVIEIKNGKFIRGQMDKKVLGGGTKGLIQRINNDFGNMTASNFIDDLQNIVTKYMISSSFSVGISDLISNQKTNDEIIGVITGKKEEVKNVIEQVQLGIFENNTGKSNLDEFEYQVNNILNQATNESGKIGLNSLDKNNRFVNMVKAGSKGSELNISFMISCLGQQNVDGKRIPYGFDQRTLPHYNKYDDSPSARGFVESSYINGLSPQELFFHAMGGRVGLIDTAVKTSTTGYIQRRLIKGLEDLMVNYDMTIRNNKNKIVQFSYGEDNFDNVKTENQNLALVEMNIQQIYDHYLLPSDSKPIKTLSNIFLKSVNTKVKKDMPVYVEKADNYIKMMITMKDRIIKNVFNNKDDNMVSLPVSFKYIIDNIKEQMHITSTSLVDITLLEAYEIIEAYYDKLSSYHYFAPNDLFKTLYFFHLSPKQLLIVKRFNKAALFLLLDTIIVSYKRAIVSPGEMVGVIAGQSIGEVSTQMTLNTFHFAGVASKSNVTRGVPRIEEILSLSSEIKNPSLSIYLNKEDETNKERARTIMYMLEHTKLQELVKNVQLCFDPDDLNTLIIEDKEMIEKYMEFNQLFEDCNDNITSVDEAEKSKWIIRLELDHEAMLEKNITMDDINFTLVNVYDTQISCIYSDYNSDKLIFRIRLNESLKSSSKNAAKLTLDQSDKIYMLKNFQDQMLTNIVIRGIKNINKVNLRTIRNNYTEENGQYVKKDIWVLDTVGTNLMDVLSLDYIDNERTFSNDIVEVYKVLGIEAARQMIYNELVDVIEFDGTYINYHNFSVLIDRMTYSHKLISIFRHGINNDNIGPLAKASFEETPEMFLRAARHGEIDNMRGISANVMCGQEGYYGTSSFQVLLNIKEMMNQQEASEYKPVNEDKVLDDFFKDVNIDDDDMCSMNNLTIQNNVINIESEDDEKGNTYDPGF